ncbi:MAG: site-specific integrase [Gracilibacteraceae bacterium]|jgi:site-specific recombinase XerD|nr:site-specific integrase [Gracilibacteraceae bacterium]
MERETENTGAALTEANIAGYLEYLALEERARATRKKYGHAVRGFAAFCRQEAEPAPELAPAALEYKEHLRAILAAGSVNAAMSALNGFFAFIGASFRLRPLALQRRTYLPGDRELSRAEYRRLLAAARVCRNWRLRLIMQAICCTGIRVSELCALTVEAALAGMAEVTSKRKTRIIFIPRKLQAALLRYAREQA